MHKALVPFFGQRRELRRVCDSRRGVGTARQPVAPRMKEAGVSEGILGARQTCRALGGGFQGDKEQPNQQP